MLYKCIVNKVQSYTCKHTSQKYIQFTSSAVDYKFTYSGAAAKTVLFLLTHYWFSAYSYKYLNNSYFIFDPHYPPLAFFKKNS